MRLSRNVGRMVRHWVLFFSKNVEVVEVEVEEEDLLVKAELSHRT